jgi:hypothetical protein
MTALSPVQVPLSITHRSERGLRYHFSSSIHVFIRPFMHPALKLSIETLDHGLLVAARNVARPSSLAQPEHRLDHTQLRRRGIHAHDGQPVIDDHACADHGRSAIDAPGHQRHLQQTAQLVLVLDRRLGMDEAALVAEGHVAAGEDVGGDGLAEDLDAESVGDDLLRFALQVWVHEGDVIVSADDVAEGGEAFFDALDLHARGEGVADVGEFLVRRRGREEEAFAVAVSTIVVRIEKEVRLGTQVLDVGASAWVLAWVWCERGEESTDAHPAVSRPTILVPAIVA